MVLHGMMHVAVSSSLSFFIYLEHARRRTPREMFNRSVCGRFAIQVGSVLRCRSRQSTSSISYLALDGRIDSSISQIVRCDCWRCDGPSSATTQPQAEGYRRARRAAAVVAGRQVSIPVATRWAVNSGRNRTDDIGNALVHSSWVRRRVHVWRGDHEAEGDLGHAPWIEWVRTTLPGIQIQHAINIKQRNYHEPI